MAALSNEDRNEMIKICVGKSEKALNSAILLSESNDFDGAANRAYYSIFQSENALLLTKGILGNSHKHVHNVIAKEFVRLGELPIDTFKKIQSVQVARTKGDYSGTEHVTKKEMENAISEAKEFLDNTKKLIAEFKLEQKKEKNLVEKVDLN